MVLFLYIIIIKIINFRDFQHSQIERETNKKKKKINEVHSHCHNAKELSRFPEHKLKANTKKLK